MYVFVVFCMIIEAFGSTVLTTTLCLKKMHQLWNGVAQNYSDRFWWYVAETFRSLHVSVFMQICFFINFSSFKPDTENSAWKLKHAISILESFEYFCQISSKLILKFLSYTVSKLVHFLRYNVVRPMFGLSVKWLVETSEWETGCEDHLRSDI